MAKKYILIGWPEIQDFMDHPRWEECVFCQEIEGHPCESSTYVIPEDLYNEVYNIKKDIILASEDIQVIKDAANFIDVISYEEGESVNPNHLDEKLLNIISR